MINKTIIINKYISTFFIYIITLNDNIIKKWKYNYWGDFINKYKICVYAICKNEEKFVNRWFESMKEADNIFVLDTVSTDNTIQILKELGVKVLQKELPTMALEMKSIL